MFIKWLLGILFRLSCVILVARLFYMYAIIIIVKLRSRSGEGQVRVRKVKETKDLDLRYTLFLVFTTHPPPPETFFLAYKGSRQVRWT